MLIKVCGLREPENIRAVAALAVDWMGFIFYPRSPRYVLLDKERVEAIRSCSRKKVGVFVDAPLEQMMQVAGELELDYLQLHGHESPETCYTLQKRGLSVIKAFPVASGEALPPTADYDGRVDYFLFDTKAAAYGGSGKRFDWSILATYTGKTPFLLSGGLHPGSLGDLAAFHHLQMAGIDLNSGFETEPALKDIPRLSDFINHYKKQQQ